MSEAAIEAALQQVELFPTRASAWLLLGRSFFEARRWPAAVEASRQAVRLDPASAGGWTLYGLSLRHGRKLEEGRSALRRAAELTPNDAVCWGNLASAHESLGELEAAESLSRSISGIHSRGDQLGMQSLEFLFCECWGRRRRRRWRWRRRRRWRWRRRCSIRI